MIANNQTKIIDSKLIVNDRRNGKPSSFDNIRQKHVGKLNPPISVIIPVLREEKLLGDTLKHYPVDLRKKFNVELIISDGGSSDETISIAAQFADIVVKHEGSHRQTIAEGRNKGAEASCGDILVFINGDTYPENPEKFFEFISNLNNYENAYLDVSALACPVYVSPNEIIFKDKIFYMLHNFYVWFLNALGMGMGRGECQIVRREVYFQVGGYNSTIAAGEDFDLYRRISKIGKIKFASGLTVFESPRRFRRYGYFRILLSWTINSLSVIFRGRSVNKVWEAVR